MKKQIPNIITGFRFLFTLSLFFTEPFDSSFYCFYLLAGLSDMLDGFLARRLGAQSKFGAGFDSTADLFFAAVCFVRLLPFIRLPFYVYGLVLLIAGIRLFNLYLGFKGTGKVIMLHTAANKLTGLLLFLFLPVYGLTKDHRTAFIVCLLALYASVSEGIKIRKGETYE